MLVDVQWRIDVDILYTSQVGSVEAENMNLSFIKNLASLPWFKFDERKLWRTNPEPLIKEIKLVEVIAIGIADYYCFFNE